MENALSSTSYYFPDKKALLLHSDLSEFFIDYYLNLKENNTQLSPRHDEQLKLLLACLSLHLTMRSPTETFAWTVHLQSEKPYSLFATGNSTGEYLVGQVLTDNIRHTDMSILHSQVSRKSGEASKSIVKSENNTVLGLFQEFYLQSEQLSLHLACLENSDQAFALVAMPGYDKDWFGTESPTDVWESLESRQYKKMKECQFYFHCNCSAERLLPYLRTIDNLTLEELFDGSDTLQANCPRCGKMFWISRKELRESH